LRVVDLQDDVAPLDSCVGRRTVGLNAKHNYALVAIEVELLRDIRSDGLHLETPAGARPFALGARELRFLQFPDFGRESDALAVANDHYVRRASDWRLRDEFRQSMLILHPGAVELDDNVATLDSRLLGRTIFLDIGD